MATFLTGGTGYVGSYVAAEMLRAGESLNLLVRTRSLREAERRLWKSLQLHFEFPEFESHLRDRVTLFAGDLTRSGFGLAPDARRRLVATTDSVIHCAASLNRRSERACLNVNFRGTLETIRAAREARDDHGLRRFSLVSTVAVTGERHRETVSEDAPLDWDRRDYDPYGRTKKMAEHLAAELLGDVPLAVFRPSVVLGDSSRPETTQFDMVRSFSLLASLPALPFRASDRLDIVPVDWVARTLASVHRSERAGSGVYHLSAGERSPTYREITDVLAGALSRRGPAFIPGLAGPARALTQALSRVGPASVRRGAALLSVFLPYLTYDTVFDNARAVAAAGASPTPFPQWAVPLLEWARRHRFAYPYAPWPGEDAAPSPPSAPRAEGSLVS
jgi:nucleoside-diphosphate-sugar epimerase